MKTLKYIVCTFLVLGLVGLATSAWAQEKKVVGCVGNIYVEVKIGDEVDVFTGSLFEYIGEPVPVAMKIPSTVSGFIRYFIANAKTGELSYVIKCEDPKGSFEANQDGIKVDVENPYNDMQQQITGVIDGDTCLLKYDFHFDDYDLVQEWKECDAFIGIKGGLPWEVWDILLEGAIVESANRTKYRALKIALEKLKLELEKKTQ